MMYIRRFAAYEDFGYLPTNKITPRHVRTICKSLETTKMLPLTINRHIAAIAGLFGCAMEMEDIDDMPAIPKYSPEQTERVRVFTPDEQKAFVTQFRETGHSWMADMFIVGCLTAMRKGEIVAVGDQGPRAAVIAPDKQSVHLPAALTKTKTGRYHDRWWNCKAREAPYDKTFTFHVTRHTCASNLANTGKNQKLIGEILGHSSEKTTAK